MSYTEEVEVLATTTLLSMLAAANGGMFNAPSTFKAGRHCYLQKIMTVSRLW